MLEDELRIALMRADLDLNPQAIVIIVATSLTIGAAFAGFAGYKLGSQPPQTIIVHLDAP